MGPSQLWEEPFTVLCDTALNFLEALLFSGRTVGNVLKLSKVSTEGLTDIPLT